MPVSLCVRIKYESYWEFLAAVFQCEDNFICASSLSSMLAVNVETQSFVYTWKQTYTKKLESGLLYMDFSMVEPAICECMWVNWFESSPIRSLHRRGLQYETKFAAAVCMCVCLCGLFIGKNSWVKVWVKWPYILRTCTQVTNYIRRSPILKEISCECYEVLHQPWSNVTLF